MTALIVYATNGGNTALLSQFVQAGLEKSGYQVTRKNVKETSIDELANYDLVVLGSSTWDEGKLQGRLHVDMRPFVEQLKNYDFAGKPVAVFGLGHYSYTFTCNAAKLLTEAVEGSHGRLVTEPFKVDDVVDLFTDSAEEWASQIRI